VLLGRRGECATLDGVLAAIRRGDSRALVIGGEAGIGKTVLLDYLVTQAAECRVLRIAGIQSEAELSFGALHQLCAPMLDRTGLLQG
jgi:predicted ATP-dependent serine protease